VSAGWPLVSWPGRAWRCSIATHVGHRQTTQIPALFRLRAVHHSDLDLDAWTAARFHPAELALSAFAAPGCSRGAPRRAVVILDR
jgi:sterol desaturase/sphingolipid hydroxylase (fatty acid hydroxylase superfamily)